MRPLILISNDDGYQACGLEMLIDMLRPIADLFVVAPSGPRSGASGSLTSEVPISVRHLHSDDGLTVYSCTGTPTDCVKIALDQLLVRQPDLVVGGINHGSNSSINHYYSGTVGVAREGAFHGIPAIAYSLCDHRPDADFEPMRPLVQGLTRQVLAEGLPKGTLLNVNAPALSDYEGVKVCRMAPGCWVNEYMPAERPGGGRYYWLTGEQVNDEPEADDTDLWAIDNGYIAITPLMLDNTDYDQLRQMERWEF